MSRIFSHKDGMKRKTLANRLEKAMNKFIEKVYKMDFPPDVSMWATPDGRRPIIKI